jgi:tRNA threonylcarbamoyladenosine biosynthesis protein TsaB
LVVVDGPGSFTGVRVGLSAAKGLSEAGGVGLIAVSRLALLAAAVDGGGGPVHVVLDAGRAEFYYGEYVGGRCLREALMSGEDVMVAAVGGVVVACETKVAEGLGRLGLLGLRVLDEPSAGEALPLALGRIEAGEFDDAASLDANYLRRTDMEIFAKAAAQRDA